jgi:hypothetical protein
MLLSAHAATMQLFLERLERDFGGAAKWFLSAGASPEILQRWQARILTDA